VSETTTPIVFEIVNPSDAYTMVSADTVAAAVACLFLGEGRYALEDEVGGTACPIFLFGGAEAWLQEAHGTTIEEVMTTKRSAVIAALRSVLIGGRQAREEVDAALSRMSPEAGRQWLSERHDKRRTSMNNIGRRAAVLADAIEAKTTN
jgi:hypothetical protein